MCKKCHSLVDRVFIKCTECSDVFHSGCTKIGTDENLRKMGQRRANWRCDECSNKPNPVKTSETTSNAMAGSNDSDLMAFLKQFREETNANLQKSFKRLDEIDNKFKIITDQLETLKNENKKLHVDVESVKAENNHLKQQISEITCDLRELQQYSKINNIEVSGVPVTPSESVEEIIEKLAHVLGVSYDVQHISAAHRLAPSRYAKWPAIVVQFVSRKHKNEWMAAVRKRQWRLNASDIHGRFDGAIYIRDHLTPHNKELLFQARTLVRENKIAYAWVVSGKVLVRKTPDGPVSRIKNVMDLSLLS